MKNPSKAEQAREFVPRMSEVAEKPHPLRKVPGFPKQADWSRYQGRWVITRRVS